MEGRSARLAAELGPGLEHGHRHAATHQIGSGRKPDRAGAGNQNAVVNHGAWDGGPPADCLCSFPRKREPEATCPRLFGPLPWVPACAVELGSTRVRPCIWMAEVGNIRLRLTNGSLVIRSRARPPW